MIDFSNIRTPFYENILDYVSEEDIYSYYLNNNIKANKLYKCCFHDDNTPSLGFYKSKSGKLYYNCFGCGEKGSPIEFVKKLFNLDYGETINKIREDFNIKNMGRLSRALSDYCYSGFNKNGTQFFSRNVQKRTEITPIFRNFRGLDYDYWNQYCIPLELLIYFEITPCNSVYVKSKDNELYQFAVHTDSNPIYHYNVDGSSKIYRPLNPSKKGKWLQNSDSWCIQGLKQLPPENDIVFITSSLKDVMVLNLLGYSAIAPHGEGILIPNKIFDYVCAVSNEVILFYNNDDVGIYYSEQHSNYYNIKSITLPVEFPKDPSDLIHQYGLKYSKTLIDSLI